MNLLLANYLKKCKSIQNTYKLYIIENVNTVIRGRKIGTNIKCNNKT